MQPLAHFKTITHHRHLVCRYCFRLGLYRQGLLHDLSKYAPCEFWRGAKYYQGYRSPNDAAPYDYYIRSKSHILIHPETSDAIEAMLRVLRDEGEDAAFAYVRGLLREEKERK